ncbi:MAG: ABC transporter ATP-binding protein [Phycisphaerales bacterium]
MIAAYDLHRWYGRTHAVRGVNLQVEPGQIVGLLGPNGAGKSTTIRLLAGVLRPDRGRITMAGVDALRHPERARRALGYLPESAAVYTEMPVAAFLRHRAAMLGLSGRDRSRAIERAAALCALDRTQLRRRLGTLSKGYRQRASLAAAILHDPSVLILDEPTNGLDPTQLREARSLIGQLAERRTVILCSHVLAEVERVCRRVVIIAGGRVLADQPIDSGRQPGAGDRCLAEVRLGEAEIRRRLPLPPDRIAVEDLGDGWSSVLVKPEPGENREISVVVGEALRGELIRELRTDRTGLEDLFVRTLDAPISVEEPSR